MSERFDVYQEAKNYFKSLLECYKRNKARVTLGELMDLDEYGYEYSIYTADLFRAVADDLRILAYAVDVEDEFGGGIANNPLWINEAISRYIRDSYGDKTADYFGIEVEDDEDDADE